MSNKKICFELNDKQQKMYNKWVSSLRGIYGEEIGCLVWSWSSNGIGETITVYSEKAKAELDLTDIDSW